MEIWQIIIIPILTVILNIFARPIEIIFLRKRINAVTSVFYISQFLLKYIQNITDDKIRNDINQWLEYPNALGSEVRIAVCIAHILQHHKISSSEQEIIEKSLASLDQRATERERNLRKE